MAIQYGAKPNVIFETFNEPLMTNEWPELKKYSEAVTAVIRSTGSRNLVLIPSPAWDSACGLAGQSTRWNPGHVRQRRVLPPLLRGDPRRGAYAGQRRGAPWNQGIPIFVSEWGTSDSTGGANQRTYLEEHAPGSTWDRTSITSHPATGPCSTRRSPPRRSCPMRATPAPGPKGTVSESGAFVKSYLTGTLPPRASGTRAP